MKYKILETRLWYSSRNCYHITTWWSDSLVTDRFGY